MIGTRQGWLEKDRNSLMICSWQPKEEDFKITKSLTCGGKQCGIMKLPSSTWTLKSTSPQVTLSTLTYHNIKN